MGILGNQSQGQGIAVTQNVISSLAGRQIDLSGAGVGNDQGSQSAERIVGAVAGIRVSGGVCQDSVISLNRIGDISVLGGHGHVEVHGGGAIGDGEVPLVAGVISTSVHTVLGITVAGALGVGSSIALVADGDGLGEGVVDSSHFQSTADAIHALLGGDQLKSGSGGQAVALTRILSSSAADLSLQQVSGGIDGGAGHGGHIVVGHSVGLAILGEDIGGNAISRGSGGQLALDDVDLGDSSLGGVVVQVDPDILTSDHGIGIRSTIGDVQNGEGDLAIGVEVGAFTIRECDTTAGPGHRNRSNRSIRHPSLGEGGVGLQYAGLGDVVLADAVCLDQIILSGGQLVVQLLLTVDDDVEVVVVLQVSADFLVVGGSLVDDEVVGQISHARSQEGKAHPAAGSHIVEGAAGEGGDLVIAGVHGGGGGGVSTNTITVKKDEGSTVTPAGDTNGKVTVPTGSDKNFVIKADDGYTITDVIVDGKSQGPKDSYEFKNIRENHTLEVKVAKLLTGDHIAYIKGYPDGGVHPTANITRAEVSAIFYRLLSVDARKQYAATSSSFADANKSWAAAEIATLTNAGILKGYTDGSFRPNAAITRAEFASIAARFDKLSGGNKTFSDVPSNHWAYAAITSAAEKGWVNGYSDGTFRPDNAITRSEVVKITNAVLGRSCDKDYVAKNISKLTSYNDLSNTYWAYYDILEASNAHDYKTASGVESWTGLK